MVAAEDLSDYQIPDNGPGILVWHSGRYRNSPVYFSYVKAENVTNPGDYVHFAGWQRISGVEVSRWSQNEIDAQPIIFDTVGEISVVYTLPDKDQVFKPFKVIYNINSAGQQGIVMRDAETPWGPYSDQIPLFDCSLTAAEMRDPSIDRIIQFRDWNDAQERFLSGVFTCYGGFSHPDLWEFGNDYTKLRFNVSSGFNPYKVFLAETKVTK